MNVTLDTLTDFEIDGLSSHYCLADGHAYQDLHPAFEKIIESLPAIWHNSATLTIPEAEQRFNKSYASFIKSPILEKRHRNFKICPTASNSIDLVGATLKSLNYHVAMIEPTFDNLALLIRRRGVKLSSISDLDLFRAAEDGNIDKALPLLKNFDAVVLIHPNNPTGYTLSENGFKNVVQFCVSHDITLVIDNCFRAHRRTHYGDYDILIESGVSFIAFEDTGKVWPTQDLKASIVYFSDDIKNVFTALYNEVYLCVSNFALGIISSFFDETAKAGIKQTIWDIVDQRRLMLRNLIAGSSFSVPELSMPSTLPVEWLTYAGTDKDDFLICKELKMLGLAVLPGRQFYWNSSNHGANQKNIRVSLMKREKTFLTGVDILEKYCAQLGNYKLPLAG